MHTRMAVEHNMRYTHTVFDAHLVRTTHARI